MDLIVQPADGLTPLIVAIKKATKTIHVTIFRFDLKELQKALESAVTRGVKVHALIAHTTGSGGKSLRKRRGRAPGYQAPNVAHLLAARPVRIMYTSPGVFYPQ